MRTTSFTGADYIPEPAREFLARRLAELIGLALLCGSGAMAVALATWSVEDPSLNHATAGPVHNLLGAPGAMAADLLMQMIGLASIALLVPLAFWSWRLLTRRRLEKLRARLILGALETAAFAGTLSLLPVTDRWPLPTGLGGLVGDGIVALPRHLSGGTGIVMVVTALSLGAIALLALTASCGFSLQNDGNDADENADDAFVATPRRPPPSEEDDAISDPGLGLVSLGALIHAILSVKAAIRRRIDAKRRKRAEDGEANPLPTTRREPNLFAATPKTAAATAGPAERAPGASLAPNSPRVAPPPAAVRPGRRAAREAQPSLLDRNLYQLPPLALLAEAKKQAIGKISEDALEQNARLLEGVLDDFGVKGEIINVRPGPVVTLYELEPAPGIKSSRVIGLADDIARSMSAIAARVAVVPGRNAIGIELPNQKRETVYLRELLASEDFEKSKHRLAIALGKTIGGEPVIVDLARMPHLLVAGTTGSGKSVAINTMILSLLYRLKPEECRLIMVDPKMLELSVYDGIPHLLTPVVTDPKKAVVALKWAVREMEDRYKKMSKLGVRNIEGFNARVAEAAAKGETITRTVQTGFDRETGEAIYEREDMDLSVLPFIVVIVDEMADLMMVAGKDIEGTIQRLAQMARAAGIHLIMATQRPS
ncbi:MAG TPA: DNA translocase FtsK 4TM domain-containing protein, partial [Beijerinckiaceae bacterium]|nr:DNA translocase FtsK 4TM domain-containing protein [Beijerinckiaceae bacterium]